MVGTLDDIHVVLDDENGVTTLYEGIEGLKQSVDVVEVQSRGGFVEDEEGRLLTFLTDEVGQLDALVLTTRERRRVLPEFDISQADVLEGFQTGDDGFGQGR